MLKKCEYCDSFYDDTLPSCPNCGAINNNVRRTNNETPKTIEELKAFFAAKHIDENKVRFFIGKDVHEPKCFGIYKNENGDFVVYKNKADGTRAIRYEGTDEAYAVNELFMRLENEFINQHAGQNGEPFSQYGGYYDSLNNANGNGYGKNPYNGQTPTGWTNGYGEPIDNPGSYGQNNQYYNGENHSHYYGGKGRRPRKSKRHNDFWKFIFILYIIVLILGGISNIIDRHTGSSYRANNYYNTYDYDSSDNNSDRSYDSDGSYDSYNSYDSYDSYDSDSSWDSDWGSDSDWDSSDWDTGSTDWDSDW